ncbi:hypothetical protein QWJ34_13365 [Saccharibacillus sp. CPCC 101409]|uniref:hypothetical protein n=1 Tax=Saccharibacillus sp. CPCC 101409 TaxID=3058041 RepID=UPI002671AE3C|nr:hypothetical protein [Saccharibacillus sp. CPCC 101409]MDO3410755.1 hypothetical protein [Saccharibacillus sp. CPCC 101409]
MNRMFTKASGILLIAFALLLGTLAGPAPARAAGTYVVTFKEARLVSNSHVGNEWYTEAQVNGKNIAEGASVKVSSDNIKLYAYAEEQDKISDVGETSKSVSASSVTSSGTTVKLKVTVTENRGRYSGQSAVWEFTYTIKKQK